MRIVVHSRVGKLERPMSFSTSGLIHGAILAYVVFGGAWQHAKEPQQSLYDQMIRPEERKIVWYRVADKLPEIRPAQKSPAPPKPLRATKIFNQEIVAGARDDHKPPQLIWAPAPEIEIPKPQALPNVVAVEQKALTKPFTPPERKILPPVAPALPDAPQVGPKLEGSAPAIQGAGLKPLVRTFQRPELPTRAVNQLAALPDAPQIGTAVQGPAQAIEGAGLKPLRKQFTPPASSTRAAQGAASSPGPDLPSVTAPHTDLPQLAVVGLDPAKMTSIPPAPPSHDASFSAGPKLRPNGASTDGTGADLSVPGLTVRGGARDSQPSVVPKLAPLTRETLLAGVRSAIPPPGTPPPAHSATHVSSAPDPMLEGRTVYTVAIQMPNVTSFSGSWIVWFAEREPVPGAPSDVRAPTPMRKVDPKYVASAAADRVEGIVRLAAVIRKTGHVDTVKLLRHLDDRLDQSAMEALAKWEFEPARRNNTPVDVDAVFEIPFRLAPKPLK